jgi:hypothetical protein
VLAAYHLAIGIRRTDGIEPADPQQNPGDSRNLALAVTASSPAAAVTSPAITPAKCGYQGSVVGRANQSSLPNYGTDRRRRCRLW